MTVSFLTLRRMAYQADRRPGMRAVLHDALLETFPEVYQKRIDWTERLAKEDGIPYIIMFNPKALAVKSWERAQRRRGRYDAKKIWDAFSVHGGNQEFLRYPWHPDFLRRLKTQDDGRLKDATLIYIAGLKRRLSSYPFLRTIT